MWGVVADKLLSQHVWLGLPWVFPGSSLDLPCLLRPVWVLPGSSRGLPLLRRLAKATGSSCVPPIVPFRGEYLILNDDKRHLVEGNIYPVGSNTSPSRLISTKSYPVDCKASKLSDCKALFLSVVRHIPCRLERWESACYCIV